MSIIEEVLRSSQLEASSSNEFLILLATWENHNLVYVQDFRYCFSGLFSVMGLGPLDAAGQFVSLVFFWSISALKFYKKNQIT